MLPLREGEVSSDLIELRTKLYIVEGDPDLLPGAVEANQTSDRKRDSV